jgi:hypothetical protein
LSGDNYLAVTADDWAGAGEPRLTDTGHRVSHVREIRTDRLQQARRRASQVVLVDGLGTQPQSRQTIRKSSQECQSIASVAAELSRGAKNFQRRDGAVEKNELGASAP